MSPLPVITATEAEHPSRGSNASRKSVGSHVKDNAWILKLSWGMLMLALAACSKGQESGVRPNGTAARESSGEVRSTSAVAFGQRRFLQSETTQVSTYVGFFRTRLATYGLAPTTTA